jgi:hypothetical protein
MNEELRIIAESVKDMCLSLIEDTPIYLDRLIDHYQNLEMILERKNDCVHHFKSINDSLICFVCNDCGLLYNAD